MFRYPSEPPSSPPEERNGPSTTPAGPPPDLIHIEGSSTPAGPPPTDLFGSSQFQPVPRTLNFNRPGGPTSSRPAYQHGANPGTLRYPSSPPRIDDEDDLDLDAEGEMDQVEYEDEEEGPDARRRSTFAQSRSRGNNMFAQSVLSQGAVEERPRVQMGAKQSTHDLLNLAKVLAPSSARGRLREPDEVILETERLLEKLHESTESGEPEKRDETLSEVTQELISVWAAAPAAHPSLADANRLASLLLSIHHPSPIPQKEQPFSFRRPDAKRYTPIPRLLLDWLNTHNEAISELALVLHEKKDYSIHRNFWEAVQASTLRGRFEDVLQLLRGANFSVAETAADDGLGEYGYRGENLANTNKAVQVAIDLLEQCPAVASDDWDIKGQDWTLFRSRVHLALDDLAEFSEGESQNRNGVSQPLQASHFGMSQSQNNFNLSVASRMAESRVPWSIYENLNRLYKKLAGDEDEISQEASDWMEAVIGLTVWWNGDEEDVQQGSLAASRRTIARTQRVRTVDITPVKAYCQRLSAALASVLDSEVEELTLKTTDRTEVGLACICDDNVEGVLQIIRGWSLPVASAVAEVATTGDWFPRPQGLFDQFDHDDLMVLSYNEAPQRTGILKDDLLTAYADQLATKGDIRSRDGKTVREGWELAVQALGRLDDPYVGSTRIEDILNNLNLESPNRVDKITKLCYGLGLSKHAQSIALKFAEHLRKNTQNYGDTLLYYARAHEAGKIQEVLRALVAHCLVRSIAYPPLDELDETLSSLITTPKQTLTKLASLDEEGAQLLSNYLSGYATIRKFYDLRDEGLGGEKPAHRPMARKRAAANALMVIISSAASSIRGGLYDPEVETVVQVDVLLPLLGEALFFVNQPKRTLTLQHIYSLLAAVEDFDTAPSMIRSQCEEVLSTALAFAKDDGGSSHLQKSTSNLTTASSQYSLIGSTDFGSVGGQSTESSAYLVGGIVDDDAKRAWDWRKEFFKTTSGSEVVRLLRLGIARETARAFSEGEVN